MIYNLRSAAGGGIFFVRRTYLSIFNYTIREPAPSSKKNKVPTIFVFAPCTFGGYMVK